MIKQLRISKGWSQEDLADKSGLSVRTIQRIERGHNMGLESSKSIAKALEVDISMLQNNRFTSDEQFLGANPILPVKSVVETTNFYSEKLGFDIETLWDDPPYGAVARGRTMIEFGEGRKKFAGSGVCLIFVSNVDDIYKEFSGKKIEFIGDLADRSYGNRDFRIKDNNGNLLIFSSSLVNKKELISAGDVRKK